MYVVHGYEAAPFQQFNMAQYSININTQAWKLYNM